MQHQDCPFPHAACLQLGETEGWLVQVLQIHDQMHCDGQRQFLTIVDAEAIAEAVPEVEYMSPTYQSTGRAAEQPKQYPSRINLVLRRVANGSTVLLM